MVLVIVSVDLQWKVYSSHIHIWNLSDKLCIVGYTVSFLNFITAFEACIM